MATGGSCGQFSGYSSKPVNLKSGRFGSQLGKYPIPHYGKDCSRWPQKGIVPPPPQLLFADMAIENSRGDTLGDVLLQPAGMTNQAPASISGQITANMGPPTNFAGYTHVVVSALQSITHRNSTVFATIPLASQYSSTLRTFVTSSNSYQLEVPASILVWGAFMPNGTTTYQQDTSSAPPYQVEVQSSCDPASVQNSIERCRAPGGQRQCTSACSYWLPTGVGKLKLHLAIDHSK